MSAVIATLEQDPKLKAQKKTLQDRLYEIN